jgi:hypothetical protein
MQKRQSGWLACAILLAWGGICAAAPTQDFPTARRHLQAQFKSKRVSDKLSAARQFGDFVQVEESRVEAVKLLIQLGFANQPNEIVRASFDTLLLFKDHPDACRAMLEAVLERKKTSGEALYPLLLVLLSSDLREVQGDTLEIMNDLAESLHGDLPLGVALADTLGMIGDKSALGPLARLVKWQRFKNEFALRRAVIQAYSHIKDKDALEAMISLLPLISGEVRSDIVKYLTQVTGQPFGVDAEGWLNWWNANKATFQFPNMPLQQGDKLAAADLAAKGMGSAYYGVPLYANRIVFIMDTSGSMEGLRLQAAKVELISAIGALPEAVAFNVLVFNSDVTAWHKALVPATPQAKQQAALFVNAQQTRFQTASYDALEAAFRFDAEAIFFVTDGAPAGGKIQRPVDIVAAVTKGNRGRRITINSIGIGVGPAGNNPFDEFLRTLAELNYGAYRRVD